MATRTSRGLTAAFVRTVSRPGKYGDRDGLILRVTPSGSKQWVWRGTVRGRRVDLGLGSARYTTLAEARAKAFEYRRLSRAGEDPRALKGKLGTPTFREAAEAVIEIYRASWRGGRNEKEWRATLDRHVFPVLGEKPVDQIDSADVLQVLAPIWNTRRETARRLRGRISMVMRWAIAERHRTDDPARDAAAALPRNGVRRAHFKAVPHAEVGAALEKIRASGAYPSLRLAIEFCVLTAARSGEARGAMWDEIDRQGCVWRVPGSRMKAGREHRAPLSTAALRVLDEAAQYRDDTGLVFPTPRGKAIGPSLPSETLKRAGVDGTLHGMRSAFTDWAHERGTSREVVEQALAHTVRNRVEAAYRRTDLFEQRRDLMETWARYVGGGDE